MSTNWRVWLWGLVAALSGAVLDAMVLPAVFDRATMKQMGIMVAWVAIRTLLAYVKDHNPTRDVWTPAQRAANLGDGNAANAATGGK